MQINHSQKELLSKEGVEVSTVEDQYKKILEGNPKIQLISPCTVGNGITKVDQLTAKTCVDFFIQNFKKNKIVFFVPASGSGSRMFRDIHTYLSTEEESSAIQTLKERFVEFPFSRMLDEDLPEYYSEEHFKKMLGKMILEEGLNFGAYPKALIPFHKYSDHIKTPLEEHVIMSLNILQLSSPYLHFTIQKNHESAIQAKLVEVKKNHQLDFRYDLSFQDPKTDAIAFDEKGSFSGEKGLYRRPGGHGALIENLNSLDADMIFIRNIDNIQHEDLASKSVQVRQMLGGVLMTKVDAIMKMLGQLDDGSIDLDKAQSWVATNLDRSFPKGTLEELKGWLRKLMERPVRVCGMVKNTGLPGGGPFWVKDQNGNLSRQIVEKAQVSSQYEQKAIFEKSTHFNPVEIVCWVKDKNGIKFDLKEFVDEKQYFIVEKTQEGKKIKYVEKPGLWNGSMAEWLTFFVEIPIEVFSPVKTFTDLLHPLHLPKES